MATANAKALRNMMSKMNFSKLQQLMVDALRSTSEMHYVLEKDGKALKVTQEKANRCKSIHSKDLKDVFQTYFDYFQRTDSQTNDIMKRYSKAIGIGRHRLKSEVVKLYHRLMEESPEKFI